MTTAPGKLIHLLFKCRLDAKIHVCTGCVYFVLEQNAFIHVHLWAAVVESIKQASSSVKCIPIAFFQFMMEQKFHLSQLLPQFCS